MVDKSFDFDSNAANNAYLSQKDFAMLRVRDAQAAGLINDNEANYILSLYV